MHVSLLCVCVQASLYHLRYEEEIPIGIISRDCAEVMQEYTQEGGVRPFGISLLVAGSVSQLPSHTHISAPIPPSLPPFALRLFCACVHGMVVMSCRYDHEGPHLFQVDPSGAYFPWKATACGKNYINAKTFLEKRSVPCRPTHPHTHPPTRNAHAMQHTTTARLLCAVCCVVSHPSSSGTMTTWSWRTPFTRRS